MEIFVALFTIALERDTGFESGVAKVVVRATALDGVGVATAFIGTEDEGGDGCG